MDRTSELFNGPIQRDYWVKDVGLGTRLLVPKFAVILVPVLVVTGLIYLSAKVISFIRLILSLFVLPGKRVHPDFFFSIVVRLMSALTRILLLR